VTGYLIEEVRRGATDRHYRPDERSARVLLNEVARLRWRRYDCVRLVHVAGPHRRVIEEVPFGQLPDRDAARWCRRLSEREKLVHMQASDFLRRVLELKGRGEANYWRLAQLETPAPIRHVGIQAYVACLRSEGIDRAARFERLETALIEQAIAELEPTTADDAVSMTA
jgi:hypothetical protein